MSKVSRVRNGRSQAQVKNTPFFRDRSRLLSVVDLGDTIAMSGLMMLPSTLLPTIPPPWSMRADAFAVSLATAPERCALLSTKPEVGPDLDTTTPWWVGGWVDGW